MTSRRSSGHLSALLLWFDAPIAGLALSALLGVNIAWDRSSAWRAFGWLGTGMLIYLGVSRLCQARVPWRVAARALMLSGAGVASYVILQYGYLGYDVKFARIDAGGRALSAFVPRIGNWTPFSNSVATFLEGLVPLTVALALARGRSTWRLVATLSGGVSVLALLLVASRGAWLAVATAFSMWMVVVIAPRRANRVGSLAALGGAALAVALVLTVSIGGGWVPTGTILSAFDRPDRVDIYRNSLVLIGDFPFTGIGLGDQFAMALARYALLIQVPFLTYSHNLYLDIWLELGLVGIISWACLVGSIAGVVVAGEQARLGTRFRGTWVGLAAVLVHALTDARQSVDGWTWLPLFVLLGLLAARVRRAGVTPGTWSVVPTLAAAAVSVAVGSPYLLPVRATWEANLGTLAQARAELGDPGAEGRSGLMAEARRHYEQAVRFNPEQPTALRRLGSLAVDEHRFRDARASLEAAWAADVGNPATRKAFGLACAWTGDFALAQELLTSVSGIVDELNVWSWWWENQGQIAPAANASRLSLLMQPDQPDVAHRLVQLENRLLTK